MDWLNYHHLYYFWTVCREGGYTKAAAKLRISQSAVSHQVAQLEDFLGARLMDRGPRGFTLTEAGQVALAEAEDIFRRGEDLVRYFRSGKAKGSLRIGAIGGLSKNLQLRILAPLVKSGELELVLEVGDPGTLLVKLGQYQLDALLTDVPFSSSESDPLVQKQIGSEPICLVGRKRKTSDLRPALRAAKEGVYLPSKGSPLTSAVLEQIVATEPGISVRGYVDDIALLRLFALETNSPVVIPKVGVEREIASKELFVLHEFRRIQQPYYLVYRQRGRRHPLLSALTAGTVSRS